MADEPAPEPSYDLASWIGRCEHRLDLAAASPLARLQATLDRPVRAPQIGDPVPPLGHWLYFLPSEPSSALGPDGHALRGGFLPPIHDLPRRMWAGGRLAFAGALEVGAAIRRVSTITDVKRRTGRSGPLGFVTVRHEVGPDAGPAVIVEHHDIVYRPLEAAAAPPAPPAPPRAPWHRELTPDAVMLFRYSALTFNGHRIHYDRRYAIDVERYPGLVVHGPLVATLLVDLLAHHLADRAITEFSYRAVSPCFDGAPIRLDAVPPDADGRSRAWASGPDGALIMEAVAMIR